MATPDPALPPEGEGEHRPAPQFDPNAAHMVRPKMRPVQGFPMQHEGRQLLGLRDPAMLSDRTVVTAPAVAQLVPMMDGSRTVDEIVNEIGKGLTLDMMHQLVAQLEDAMLIEGPKFDAHVAKMKEQFDAEEILPPATTANIADMLEVGARRQAYMIQKQEEGQVVTPQELMNVPEAELKAVDVPPQTEIMARQFDAWMNKALEKVDDPSFDALPKAIVAPHIDYMRGWPNYGAVYGRLRVADRPDRVIILGTNHHGRGTGVVGCEKGFRTPFGDCKLDQAAFDSVKQHLDAQEPGLSDKLLIEQFDHEREHSVELQVPWIQHIFGKDDAGEYVPVVGFLCHDPSRTSDGASYDGNGVGILPFTTALRQAIEGLPGRTFVVISADLSHVGPQFGEQKPVDEDRRKELEKHDREMLDLICGEHPEELVSSMAWQQNPTRWCSIGNIVAGIQAVGGGEVRMLSYGGAADPQGMGCVTSAAMVVS
jgi:AmmeMemoRadiSam system protein B